MADWQNRKERWFGRNGWGMNVISWISHVFFHFVSTERRQSPGEWPAEHWRSSVLGLRQKELIRIRLSDLNVFLDINRNQKMDSLRKKRWWNENLSKLMINSNKVIRTSSGHQLNKNNSTLKWVNIFYSSEIQMMKSPLLQIVSISDHWQNNLIEQSFQWQTFV